jgi:hypothetical protein
MTEYFFMLNDGFWPTVRIQSLRREPPLENIRPAPAGRFFGVILQRVQPASSGKSASARVLEKPRL